jgi:anti-anti-sigma factor
MDVQAARHRMGLHLLETAVALDSIATPPEASMITTGSGNHIEALDQPTIVKLARDIDTYNSRQLAEQLYHLIQQGHVSIVLGLEDLHFIDSTGLGVIVRTAKQARAAGGQLLLRKPRSSVEKILEITGLNRILTILN